VARNIGIVGAGIAGLHLALYLQKHGVDATIITDRPPEEYRSIRLLNTVAHHHVTIAREDYLGVNHWGDPKDHYYYHDHVFNFPQPPISPWQHMVERSYGSFSRSLQLPSGVDADRIKAPLSNGVLKVVIPKPAATSAKKIEVKAS
jgi:Hsp20/alpha crystallin family protein/FAD binding domain-containing protein